MKGIRDNCLILVTNKYISYNVIFAKLTNFTIINLYKLFNELLNNLRTIEVLYVSSAINKEQRKLLNNKNSNSNNKKTNSEYLLLKNFPPTRPKGTIFKFIKEWLEGLN